MDASRSANSMAVANSPPTSVSSSRSRSPSSSSPDGGNATLRSQPAPDNRRARACEACRLSKVRCELPNPNLPCLRCARTDRDCFMSYNTTANSSNNISHNTTNTTNTTPSSTNNSRSQFTASSSSNDASSFRPRAAQKRGRSPSPQPVARLLSICSAIDRLLSTMQQSSSVSASPTPGCSSPISELNVNAAISQSVSDRTAASLFDHYNSTLAAHFPAVLLDPNATPTSALELRSLSPVLFLAIITAAAGSVPDCRGREPLRRLLARVLSTSIDASNDEPTPWSSNLECVQAMIISAAWYSPLEPDGQSPYVDLRQLCHAAMNLAIRAELDRQPRTYGSPAASAAELQQMRAWLACYFLHTNACMTSQEAPLVRWTSSTNDMIDRIRNSPFRSEYDDDFCRLVQFHSTAFELTCGASSKRVSSPSSAMTPTNSSGRIVDEFKLQCWHNSMNSIMGAGIVSSPSAAADKSAQGRWDFRADSQALLRMMYHSSIVYLHDLNNANATSKEPGTSQGTLAGDIGLVVDPSRVDSDPTDMLDSAQKVASIFISFSEQYIPAIPTIFFIRLIHSIVVLTQHSGSSRVDSPRRDSTMDFLTNGFEDDATTTLEVENLIDDLIDKMANGSAYWPSHKVIQVLNRLRRQLREKRRRSVAPTSAPTPSAAFAPVQTSQAIPQSPEYPNLMSMCTFPPLTSTDTWAPSLGDSDQLHGIYDPFATLNPGSFDQMQPTDGYISPFESIGDGDAVFLSAMNVNPSAYLF